ncbi:MAG: SdpI family protein [Chloroflexota bacterium]
MPPGTQIPIHWNAEGEVNGYAGKAFGLLFVPALTLALTGLFAIIPRIDPRGDNIMRSWEAYRIVWIGILVLMLGIQAITILTAFGSDINTGFLIPAGVGVLFIFLGNSMGKIRPNYMFGIRTPWTLTSELSWNKTHRLAGWLFVALGILMIAGSAFGQNEYWVWGMVIGVFVLVGVTFTYSYIVWKNDPDRKLANSFNQRIKRLWNNTGS